MFVFMQVTHSASYLCGACGKWIARTAAMINEFTEPVLDLILFIKVKGTCLLLMLHLFIAEE